MADKLADFKELVPDYAREEKAYKLFRMRHTTEHVLMLAMQRLYGKDAFHMAMGPATEEGYYFDFEALGDFEMTEDKFEEIEAEMQKIIKEDLPVRREEISLSDAKELFKDNPYKQEWLSEIEEKDQNASVYWLGEEFVDLCKGPHVESTGRIGVVKLLTIAGAYWRGDENKQMLVRVYGTAFPDKKALKDYLWRIEEAKKRDHRKLGKELDLFTLSELVGSGLPMFTPRGTILREEANKFSQELRFKKGFQLVWTPHITKTDLYKTSGHWDKFGDELFLVQSQETDDKMVMKPMNCPHHQQIYDSRPRSYKELPLKYMETTTDYRDEKTGELQGLSRVRALTQDDSHTFCTPEQIEEVYNELIEIVKEFYETLGMKYKARLSFRDPNQPEKYIGDEKLWEKAQAILKDIAEKNELDYYEAEGEAAFYGPKIDFMVEDALGREWQLGTPQLDFVQPERFGLKYTDADGKEKTPVMIHFALAGALERFLSVYIEHTAGAFPAWIAPEQVRIIPISDENLDYAQAVAAKLAENGIRYQLDGESERMQNKVRKAQEYKVPYMLILGKKEEAEQTVSLRYRSETQVNGVAVDDFIKSLLENIKSRKLEIELDF